MSKFQTPGNVTLTLQAHKTFESIYELFYLGFNSFINLLYYILDIPKFYIKIYMESDLITHIDTIIAGFAIILLFSGFYNIRKDY